MSPIYHKVQKAEIVANKAKSGTGKTCVYAVTILQSILDNQKNKVLSSSVASVQAMVMVPTRELASQVAIVLAQLKKGIESETRHVNIVTCVGGTSLKQDCHALSKVSSFHYSIYTHISSNLLGFRCGYWHSWSYKKSR